jgi:hypothetical protein
MLDGGSGMSKKWPHLDYLGWRETCSALHLYLQIAGKYRLAHTPWLNHSWNATFYVTPRGRARAIFAAVAGAQLMARSRAEISVFDALIDSYRVAGLLPANGSDGEGVPLGASITQGEIQ